MAVKRSELQPTEKEAAQPENPDAALMIGGPGQEEPAEREAPPEPQPREITIRGQKFAVDPQLAQALEQRDRDIDRKLSEHSQELGELRKLKQSYQPEKPQQAEQQETWSTILFADPDAAVKRLKAEIKKETLDEAKGFYDQDKSEEKFWNNFYRQNTDLDRNEDDFIIRAVLQEHIHELAPMNAREAGDRLADYTRRQILRLSQKSKLMDDDDNQPAPRTRVEPASRSTPRAAPKEPEGPSSLSDAIKARRAARLAGKRPAA